MHRALFSRRGAILVTAGLIVGSIGTVGCFGPEFHLHIGGQPVEKTEVTVDDSTPLERLREINAE